MVQKFNCIPCIFRSYKPVSYTHLDTNNDISQVSSKINTLNSEISSKESEINYLLSSIEKVKKYITKKEEQMKQRLYVMQTTYNSNWMLDFLFGAEDFTTFFSRLTSLNDITSYEKELVADLTKQKESLDSQKETLLNACLLYTSLWNILIYLIQI